ncbi:Fe-S cluster assembly protein SufD [Maricaulis sp.]|uniref:Fe-S cluster assembly protein SufD n=1 Tax=Maricaulis sp. TaxID=1486257 RepID=UPI003298B721
MTVATLTHTPAEQALIAALQGATGWRGQLREATREQGLPTKRNELWKWSDLRRAANDVSAAGELVVDGLEAASLRPDDGARLNLTLTAKPGASAADAEITVPAGHAVTLVEHYRAEAGALGNWHLKITLETGARLDRVCIAADAPDGVFVSSAEIVLAPGAALNQRTLDFGAKLSRIETHITHPGEGSQVDLGGVYLLDARHHADSTTVVHHTGPGGQTRQLVKGAAASHGHGVFQGKFIVDRAAQQTDARMTHRALMLDDRAEIDAKPELEIYADDVQCAHGNALGAIDETALFYMRQRGLPAPKARALLIESFLAEPLDGIADESLRETLKGELRNRLEALS